MQTLATTRNIVGPNNVVPCCATLADVCKRSQQHVGSLDENTKDSGTFSISYAMLRVRRRNIVGCAVQTNAKIVGPRFDDRETIEMLALVGSEV